MSHWDIVYKKNAKISLLIQKNNNNFKDQSINRIKFSSKSKNEIVALYEKNKHNIDEIINILKKEKVEIEDIVTVEGDLEDVFIKLTKN